MTEDLFANTQEIIDIPATDAQLRLYPHIYPSSTTQQLFEQLKQQLQWRQDVLKIHGRDIPIPRLNTWYGDAGTEYSYSGVSFTPHPWTKELLHIKYTIETLCGEKFNSVLANLYRDGQDSVAWHSDDEPELGRNPVIASLSLGATREFVLKHKRRKDLKPIRLSLADGSLLLMAGPTQHHWIHQVPKTRKLVGARINLTFRWVQQSF